MIVSADGVYCPRSMEARLLHTQPITVSFQKLFLLSCHEGHKRSFPHLWPTWHTPISVSLRIPAIRSLLRVVKIKNDRFYISATWYTRNHSYPLPLTALRSSESLSVSGESCCEMPSACHSPQLAIVMLSIFFQCHNPCSNDQCELQLT